MTASQSASGMEKTMRSRRMPALLIKMSSVPNASTAWSIMRLAPLKSLTSSPLTMASPPMPAISAATCCAGVRSAPVPSGSPPRSLTTTLAPWLASMSACSRPMPRPAPVTTATRPSHSFAIANSPSAPERSTRRLDAGLQIGPDRAPVDDLIEVFAHAQRESVAPAIFGHRFGDTCDLDCPLELAPIAQRDQRVDVAGQFELLAVGCDRCPQRSMVEVGIPVAVDRRVDDVVELAVAKYHPRDLAIGHLAPVDREQEREVGAELHVHPPVGVDRLPVPRSPRVVAVAEAVELGALAVDLDPTGTVHELIEVGSA